jgi:hypothetical protein
MKCPKCDGKGWYANPRYPNPASWSWAGEPSFPCRNCGKSGYIIGNTKDVVDFLKHLKVKFEIEKDSHYLKMTKQCLTAITGEPAAGIEQSNLLADTCESPVQPPKTT